MRPSAMKPRRSSSCDEPVWSSRQSETLRVDVERGKGILAQDALLPPLAKVPPRRGEYTLFSGLSFSSPPAKDDADEVVRAGLVVAILQGGSDLVVGLGHHFCRERPADGS